VRLSSSSLGVSIGCAPEPILKSCAAVNRFRTHWFVLSTLLEMLDYRNRTHHIAKCESKFVGIELYVLVTRGDNQIFQRSLFKVDHLANRFWKLERDTSIRPHFREGELNRRYVRLR